MKFEVLSLVGLTAFGLAASGVDRTQLPTRVVRYSPPSTLPDQTKPGECQMSLAAGYRGDAFRCTADNATYDPCFATAKSGHVLCDVDPRKASSGTLVRAVMPDAPTTDSNSARNRAWLFELTDGTLCRPLLDNRREIDGMTEIYTCKWVMASEADGVLGELDSSTPVWTIQQVWINKKVEPMTIKSLLTAAVKTVWQ